MNKVLMGSLVIMTIGCGVKGNPKPPFKPAQISRGKPSYSGATQSIAVGLDKEPERQSEKKKDKKLKKKTR